MGEYFDSKKIEIFPISSSRPDFNYAHVLTEDHVLDLIRSVAPSYSFVLTEEYDPKKPFEFMINGYHVTLRGSEESPLEFTWDNVFAHIFIDTYDPDYPRLWGYDSDDKFYGVTFSTSENHSTPMILSDNVEKHSLHILKKVDGQYIIPHTSRKYIDGGYIP